MRKAKNELNELLISEGIMWRQRFGVQWMRGGDKNTKFFHSRVSARKRKNRISRQQEDNREWHEGREKAMGLAQTYFQDLFTTSNPSMLKEAISAMENEVNSQMNLFSGYAIHCFRGEGSYFPSGCN